MSSFYFIAPKLRCGIQASLIEDTLWDLNQSFPGQLSEKIISNVCAMAQW